MKGLAFSLIELMVVIAIVVVLAAVAMPTYKLFLAKSRISTLVPIVEDLVKRSNMYYIHHGYFPNAEQLGFELSPWGPNFVSVADKVALSPLIAPNAQSNFFIPGGTPMESGNPTWGINLASVNYPVVDGVTCNAVGIIAVPLDDTVVGTGGFVVYMFGYALDSGEFVIGCESFIGDDAEGADTANRYIACPAGIPIYVAAGVSTGSYTTGGSILPQVCPPL
jgi:prepilin-type N-terminal cleavage/methylation domain-containing protein